MEQIILFIWKMRREFIDTGRWKINFKIKEIGEGTKKKISLFCHLVIFISVCVRVWICLCVCVIYIYIHWHKQLQCKIIQKTMYSRLAKSPDFFTLFRSTDFQKKSLAFSDRDSRVSFSPFRAADVLELFHAMMALNWQGSIQAKFGAIQRPLHKIVHRKNGPFTKFYIQKTAPS